MQSWRHQDSRHQDGQPPTRPAAGSNSKYYHQHSGARHAMETSETNLQTLAVASLDARRERRKGKTRPEFILLFLHILLFGHQLENILFNFRRRRKSLRSQDKIRFCLLICLLASLIRSVAGQREPMADNYLSSEPQPLVYQSVRDLGSGDGPKGLVGPTSSSSSVSPSLISAKCWNNYENDNDCKQINVITGDANGQPMAADDDSIITPVVIFESSSTIEPSQSAATQQPQVFLAPPYYEGSQQHQQSVSGASRHRTTPASSDVSLMPEYQVPTNQHRWRPTESVATGTTPMPSAATTGRPRGGQFVATPRPKKPLKSTTAGRRCRDENDDDCDEPEDANDNEDDNDDAAARRPTSSTPSSSFSSDGGQEMGSGLVPGDDNENDDDDDDDDNSSEQAEISGDIDPSSSSPDTSEVNQYASQVTTEAAAKGGSSSTTTTTKEAGAEIEVLVHPTLPPLFPTTSTTTTSSSANQQETQVSSRPAPVTSTPSTTTTTMMTTTTTTTMMPDDTYTSRPVFPSSTSPTSLSSGDATATSSLDPIDAIDLPANPNNDSTSADLYKFVPMPLPTMEPPRRAVVGQANQTDNTNHQDKVNEWNRFEPSANDRPGRFGDFAWQQQQARQRPQLQSQLPAQLQPDLGPPHPSAGSAANAPIAQSPVAREMLPQLLLYACLVVLIVTASIFIVMAFVLWRRNSVRHRQLLMNKSAMLNGYAPPSQPHGGHLPPSMSHASQLMANMQQQPRLLGAYGSAAGANGLGKVTASIVEEDESASLLNNQGVKEHGKGGGGKYGGRGDASWTENSEPTTTSGESIKTGDSQQEQVEAMEHQQQQQQQLSAPYQNQHQLQHQQRLPYPNSLSDGRQNSSSISDSSPIDGAQLAQQQQQQQQQPPPMLPNLHYSPDPNHTPYPPPQVQPPHLQRSTMNFNGYQQQQDVGYHQQPPLDGGNMMVGKRFTASRSVEDLQPGAAAGFHHPNSHYPMPPSQPMPPQQQQQHQQHFYPRRMSQEMNTMLPANFQTPARTLAMNPLATLSRRHPIQRNIYSEDSSSFTMTASPSLARTSSSSSFAFNSSQVSSVRMKPLVDAAGRLFNDYTPTGVSSYAGGASGPPPPVLGRKERSEAWYV